MTKQETGALGEQIVLSYLHSEGMTDAHPLNGEQSNFPVDAVQNHGVIEIKTGLASNGRSAQQWRATIGQPGKTEAAWLKTASPDEKKAWNQEKAQAIIDRKQAACLQIGAEIGHAVKGSTMTAIINPDTRTADLYKFSGFHSRIDWNSPQAKAGYLKSVHY